MFISFQPNAKKSFYLRSSWIAKHKLFCLHTKKSKRILFQILFLKSNYFQGFNFSPKDLQNKFFEIILFDSMEYYFNYLDCQFQNKIQNNYKELSYDWNFLKLNKQPVIENLNLMSIK